MRRGFRIFGFLCLGLVSLIAAGAAYLLLAFPRMVPARTDEVAATPEKLARGRYLAEHVTVCVDCHSERDFSKFSGPPVPGTFGKGGDRFGHDLGLPGEVYAQNITPYKLGSWSDGELIRALTSGVTPDGRALFPLMNWPGYGRMCKSDIEALVTYVRALAPIEHTPPKSSLDFPVNLIARTMPEPAKLAESCPDGKDTVEQGRYLVSVAGCADCHTPREGSELVQELAFSGGVEIPLPTGGKVRSKNLTPDVETGIGSWTREAFIKRFALYRDPANIHEVEKGGFNTLMPWAMYSGMSDEDLGAIYDFLRTQKPVKSQGPKVASN